jgi:hypothetical protein
LSCLILRLKADRRRFLLPGSGDKKTAVGFTAGGGSDF